MILASCYTEETLQGERFITDHILGYVESGSLEITAGGTKTVFRSGDFRFLRKNQMIRYTKRAGPEGQYRSITISLDQETLRSVRLEKGKYAHSIPSGAGVMLLEPNELLKTYIQSLMPYLDSRIRLNRSLTILKVKEAIMLLLEIHPELERILFDFTPPGKIDLEAYMNSHYKHNIKLNRFAYLTGRSLASFKRDFKGIFKMSPSQWLLEKRLSDAWYLIRETGARPVDVYKTVGFKNLSHFTSCFRKKFGTTPNKLRRKL